MMSGSVERRDLDRDPRAVLNSVITSPSPEAKVKVRGTARPVTDEARRERDAAAVSQQLGWRPVTAQFTLFLIELQHVTYQPGTAAGGVAAAHAGPVSSASGSWP